MVDRMLALEMSNAGFSNMCPFSPYVTPHSPHVSSFNSIVLPNAEMGAELGWRPSADEDARDRERDFERDVERDDAHQRRGGHASSGDTSPLDPQPPCPCPRNPPLSPPPTPSNPTPYPLKSPLSTYPL